MDYEKYKNALEKARLRYNEIKDTDCSEKEFLLDLFPELKESEDERIRKGIIDFLWKEKIFLQEVHSSVENNPKYRFVMDAIAWLEKQGEEFDDNIITRDDEILQAISIGLTDAAEDLGWSDFGGLPIEEIQNWLEKQGEKKSTWSDKDEEMLKWTNGNLTELKEQFGEKYGKVGECISWLKSLKERLS